MTKPNKPWNTKWKLFRMGIASRKIDLMKKMKFRFGWPKEVPNFREEMIRIGDGKQKKNR